jgi:transcriptional regulator with XRE-family HTH domain
MHLLNWPGFGGRVRDLRERKGVGLNDLARRAGISAGALSQAERGLHSPTLRNAERIAACLDSSVGELLNERTDEDA